MLTETLPRDRLKRFVATRLESYPVVAVLGARQVGKTSLARQFASSPAHQFDLENSIQLRALTDNPLTILGSLQGTVVIDEIQELPSVFPVLRVLADRQPTVARFVVSGSVSPRIIHGISESLAGRVATVEMGGFDLDEAGPDQSLKLWLRGSHPPSFLAATDADSLEWRANYLERLIGRDLRIWSNLSLEPAQTRKLLTLISDCTGRAWNHSAAAKILQIDVKTVQRYVDLLEAAYLVRLLPPYEANVRKRLRKAPAIHLRDSGITHSLLNIQTMDRLLLHPISGHSWESFCIDQIIRLTSTRAEHCFTFSLQSGPELDLLLDRPEGKFGFEIKSSENSRPKESDAWFVETLGLTALHQIRRGSDSYQVADRIFSTGVEALPSICAAIREPM